MSILIYCIYQLSYLFSCSLECDEECAQLERNRRLADALNITDPDLPPLSAPNYSSFLLEMARSQPELVTSVEKSLKHLVHSAQVEILYYTRHLMQYFSDSRTESHLDVIAYEA